MYIHGYCIVRYFTPCPIGVNPPQCNIIGLAADALCNSVTEFTTQ